MTDHDDAPSEQAHVLELLESWNGSVASMPSDAKLWIELSCALRMPPDIIAHFYDRHLLWAGLAVGITGIEQLRLTDVAAVRSAFFFGSIGVKGASERLRRLIPAPTPRPG